MDRRAFLKVGAAAVAGGVVAAGSLQAEAPEGREESAPGGSRIAGRVPGARLQLSCAAYSFRRQLSGSDPAMTLEDFIDFCAREGLEATELTSYYFRRTDPEYLRSLRRRAYVNGLAISGTPVGNDFTLPPGPERERSIEHVKSWIDQVTILGSQTIRVFSGGVPRGSTEAEARGRAIEAFKEVSAYAGERGVLLALENHGGLTAAAEGLLDLVTAVDSPWFGVNLDTGNFHRQVYRSLEQAAPYAVSVQVKVEVREAGEPAAPADFHRIVDILLRAGYRGYVALEYEAAEDPLAAVPRHLKALRAAIRAAEA